MPVGSGEAGHLEFALILLAVPRPLTDELATAAQVTEEDRMMAEASGDPPVAYTAHGGRGLAGLEQKAAGAPLSGVRSRHVIDPERWPGAHPRRYALL